MNNIKLSNIAGAFYYIIMTLLLIALFVIMFSNSDNSINVRAIFAYIAIRILSITYAALEKK